jgi:uncharacterized protein (DUF4415 family)
MPEEKLIRSILTADGQVLIEQPDGSYKPEESKTDWARLDAMTDEEITAAALDDPDAQPLDDEFWRTARVLQAPIASPKKHTGIRIDTEVLDWFKRQGRGWQTRMNAVLRAYYERHKDA